MYVLRLLLSVGLLVASLHGQACPPSEVLFLLDESENALMAASTDPAHRPFDLLQNAIRSFAQHPIITNSVNEFRIGAISYSSGRDQFVSIPLGSTPRQAAAGVTNIGRVGHAESTTSRGLEFITTRPTFKNALLIVISSQGSGTVQGRQDTSRETQRVMQTLGWKPYVIAAQGRRQVDISELTIANNGVTPVFLPDQSVPPKGYLGLTEALNMIVEEMLCIDALPPQPAPSQAVTCPPTEVLFLLDESENAHLAASTDLALRPFDLLQQAIRDFVSHPLIASSTNDFRLGAISYSSGNDQFVSIPLGTDPRHAGQSIPNIGQRVGHGGSWTFRGLEAVNSGPRYPSSNLLIVVSSQGSRVPERQNLARLHAQRVTQVLGWNPYVIVVEGASPVDNLELTSVNNGQPPYFVRARENPPKGYRYLTEAFNKIIEQKLCTQRVAPPAPVKKGICSDCLYEAGHGFDFDPVYCDSYYMCLPNQPPKRKSCPVGTFWSGAVCDFMEKVNCAAATCTPTTPNGSRYPSGRCCNKYFECNGGTLTEMSCPRGQIFDKTSRVCVWVSDTSAICESQERYICDVDMRPPGARTQDCGMYSPDVFGNPCRFQFANYTIDAPVGTVWNQASCSLVFANTDQCGARESGVEAFFGATQANVCTATFLASFTNGKRTAFSERMNRDLAVAASIKGARLQQNGLVFESSAARPYAYYFFFSNRAIKEETAFKVRFSLDQTARAGRYDLLSNNFCQLCPETVSITVTTRGGQREVTAAFTLTNGQTVITTTPAITKRAPSNLLEATVVVGKTSIGGHVREFSSSNPVVAIATTPFNSVPKPSGADVQPNRCGFMLGQGPNDNFVGIIDQFTVYEYCRDINQVLA